MFGKKPTTSLEALRELSADSSVPLADVLRRAKVLAASLRAQDLKDWVDSELNGYYGTGDVPAYRHLHVPPLGLFHGPFGSRVSNLVIPTMGLPEALSVFVEGVPLHQPVRELEEMATRDDLRFIWPAEAVMIARESVALNGGYVLAQVHQPILQSAVQGVLDVIRNRLLDFVLELQELNPGVLTDDEALKEIAPEDVSQIFNLTIQGDHNIVASGKEVRQQVSHSIPHGDVAGLMEFFRRNGLAEEDLRVLKDALEGDPAPEIEGVFGPRITAWIGQTVSKAAGGLWKVSLTTAPILISKALSKYYGWE